MKIFIFLLVPLFVFGQQVTLGHGAKLDELLIKSGKIRTEGIEDFAQRVKTMVPTESAVIPMLIQSKTPPPNKTVPVKAIVPVEPETNPIAPPVHSSFPKYVPYSVYVADRQQDQQKMDSLEGKITMILENVVESSKTVKGSVELSLNFMETLTSLLVALGGIVGGLNAWRKFRKKKK